MEETILSKIKDEHLTIKAKLSAVESCLSPGKKLELYHQLKKALVRHLTGEEHTIYKHFREEILKPVAQELIHMTDYEHHQMKEYLQRLNLLQVTNPAWIETFNDLKELVELHCKISEQLMFTEAKEDFSREELIAIGTEYEQQKSQNEDYFFL